ncbi:MAG TPA: hypothetical protein ENH20_00560 [Candidatus Pacearchaeota archaeon]|nr:hypothetical protein [Candidatus Pacearchaeota archaeon]
MKKIVGYIVSIFGIIIMAVGLGVIPVGVDFLSGVGGNYLVWIGIVGIVVGVVMSLKSGAVRKGVSGGESEVPIYEGVGKARKVVGYRKD